MRGSPSAGGLWLGGVSWDRGGGPPKMGLHVAGQLGRGLAVHAAQLAQDAVSPRGLEPMVLHRVDAQVCCRGEAYWGGIGLGGWGQPGGDPRDGAVLLGGGCPAQWRCPPPTPSWVDWGWLDRAFLEAGLLEAMASWPWRPQSPSSMAGGDLPGDRTRIPSHLKD